MIAFIDFEASSLGRHGFPVEVGWVLETGAGEDHLIRPAPGWEEWDATAEAVHHLPRARLDAEGEPHEAVAARLLAALSDHLVFASAPSWDGQWLSRLLRAAGLPRHALRLRDTAELHALAMADALADLPEAARTAAAGDLLAAAERAAGPPAHRALTDAERERRIWLAVRRGAAALGRAGRPS